MAGRLSAADTPPTQKIVLAFGMILLASLSLVVSYVVGANENLAILIVLGVAVFFFAFLNMDFALAVLVLSMLLSPEFSIGSAGGSGQMAQRGVVIRIDDLIVGLITVSWFVKTAVKKDLGIFIQTPLNKPIFFYILASLFATLLGIIMGNVRPMIGILYNVKYFQYFLIYFMVASQVKDMKGFKKYLRLIIFTAVVVSIYAMAQIPSGMRVSAPFEGEGGEANTLGGYLVVIMSLVIGLMTGAKKIKHVLGLGFLLLIMLIPFAYTLSRSSWISMFPVLVVFIIFSPQRKAIMGVLLLIGLALPFVIPKAVIERIEYTFSMEHTQRIDAVNVGDTALDPSTSERINSWSTTIKDWTKRPIFGYGVTGAGFKDAQYFRVLVETGIVGFLAFFWLLRSIHRVAKSTFEHIDPERHPMFHGIGVGFLGAYWGLLVHAIGANTFIIVRVMEPFWFLMALVLLLPEFTKAHEDEEDLDKYEKYLKMEVTKIGTDRI